MIFEGSRYADAPIYRVPLRDGRRELAVYALEYWPSDFVFSTHLVEQGDRLDLLATDYYGDAEAWWWIALANPGLEYPGELPVGKKIRIPHE